MSMSSENQGPRGPQQEGPDQTKSGPEHRGMHPEDEKLISKPVSRQDEMMRVAIAGFLGLFLVTMALAQSRQSPEDIPEPQIIPALAELPPPAPPESAEMLPPPPPPPAPMRSSGDNRLYGRVVTTRGREYEGYIRWDRNEGSWADLLDANKRVASRSFERDRHDRHIRVRGVRISWRDNDLSSSVSSGIRFGHISRIEPMDSRSAIVSLKSGEQVRFDGNATDLGSALRRLVVVDADHGHVELRWRDIEVVEFMDSPTGDLEQAREESLYGTMVTRSGTEFTGYVSWDVDEIFHSDILDGEDRGVDREIRFGDVAVIARNSSASARVTLQDGEDFVLRGSNDVDSSNNGISISDPGLGQVKIDWDEFEELRFHAPESHMGRNAFDGGHRLYGTVTTLDGDELTGYVLWDNDEAYSWEMLNGKDDGVVFHVEFGQIQSVRRRSHRGATVTLLDGRTLQLSDSNDVNDGNRRIVVTNDDGDSTLVSWGDFEEVRFHSR